MQRYEELIIIEIGGKIFALRKEYREISIDGYIQRQYCYRLPQDTYMRDSILRGLPCPVVGCWGYLRRTGNDDIRECRDEGHRFKIVEDDEAYLVCIRSS